MSNDKEIKNNKEDKSRNIKKLLFPALAVSLALSFLVAIYGPMEAYFVNKVDFWFDFYTIIGMDLIMFILFTAVGFGILVLSGLIHKKLFRVFFTAAAVTYFTLYAEGTFLSRDIPMLDGRDLDWNDFSVHRIISIALILILTAIAVLMIKIFKYEKVEAVLKYVVLGMTLMLLITAVTLCIQNKGLERKKSMIVTKEHEFEFSSDKNVVYLILDAVNGDVFEDVLEKHPEYYEDFSDFTYYSDMLSCYTQTIYAIPNMLTGEWNNEDEDLSTYVAHVFNNSPLFDRLENDGYRIGIYDTYFTVAYDSDRITGFENIHKTNVRNPDVYSFVKNQIRIVGYRYAPYDLKRFCQVTDKDFHSAKDSEEKENLFYESNTDFYNDLKNAEFQISEQPAFRFYHVDGGHVPFNLDENLNTIDNGSYELQIAASMTIARTMVEKMKEAGIYDNSIIIIAADHGFSESDIPEERLHPIFFVKGIDEHSETMKISDAPVSHEDLIEAYNRLFEGAAGTEIFDYKSGDQRDRRCFVYTYPELLENVEYIQHGRAGDTSTLEKTGNGK